nr:zinc-binding dehydrogenase [Deltaproteobacteria bacterium]
GPIVRLCSNMVSPGSSEEDGIYVGSRDMQNQFHQALDVNKIHPVIDRVFKFDQAKEAYAYMQSGRHFGKIVIHLES